jgi:hypothetical protein
MSYGKWHVLSTDTTRVELRETWIDPVYDIWAWKVYACDDATNITKELDPGDGLGMSLPRALIVAAAYLANPEHPFPEQRFIDAACTCINVITLED